MAHNLHSLLTIAAEMRASGMSWQSIANRVHRKAGTCSKWPSRYRADWGPIFLEAQKNRYEELNSESLTFLRGLLRADDDKTKLKSIEMVLRYGPPAIAAISAVLNGDVVTALPVGRGGRQTGKSAANEPLATVEEFRQRLLQRAEGRRAWATENVEKEFRKRIDAERAGKGLEPVTDFDFPEALAKYMHELENPKFANIYWDENGCPLPPPPGEPEWITGEELDARLDKEYGPDLFAAPNTKTLPPHSDAEPPHPGPLPRSGGEGENRSSSLSPALRGEGRGEGSSLGCLDHTTSTQSREQTEPPHPNPRNGGEGENHGDSTDNVAEQGETLVCSPPRFGEGPGERSLKSACAAEPPSDLNLLRILMLLIGTLSLGIFVGRAVNSADSPRIREAPWNASTAQYDDENTRGVYQVAGASPLRGEARDKMPKRTDLHKILLIGSGPIIIGQACEFDYSGTQACKALREEGYHVVLVNSNPATIMTDPEVADRTYIEPITWQVVEKIIQKERPDALLPTLGGQTGLNTAMDLYKHGVLERYKVEMIGARADVIAKAEDRALFKEAILKIGLEVPRSGVARSLSEAHALIEDIGLPCVLRPSFTMGGTGGGIAYNREEFNQLIALGLELSPVNEVLIEESVIGWKEFELEVMRDRADNVVIVCSIENLDPMGVHTGDSITVAPAQTLSDKEYQRMRDAAKAIIREIGVETGGSNIQFAVNPVDGRMTVIEMNPRVSRSSALASKATGFPIAKIAAKLAVGYTLDELRNDITRETPACFEPTIDYVVTKVPRFNFEKFPEADVTLTTQMKSVGETMAIGRTFKESLQKALRGLEVGRFGIGADRLDRWGTPDQPGMEEISGKLATPNAERIWFIRYALKAGLTVDDINQRTRIDKWFLTQIQELVQVEEELAKIGSLEAASFDDLLKAKQYGFVDRQLANLWNTSELEVRRKRIEMGIKAVFKLVDTCAAEFEAYTPYYYSTYEAPIRRIEDRGQRTEDRVYSDLSSEDELRPFSGKPKIIILGGGPNRIGQGIEFDYCCVQAVLALRKAGFETFMVNSNPETVSTDYDTSDHLFFEPLTVEDVLNICDRVQPDGVIVQFGGQTPLNLAKALESNGVPIIGTSVESIEVAEDRKLFSKLIDELELKQPASGTTQDLQGAMHLARKIGFPVLVRPSFVLGGRAMEIVYDEGSLERYVKVAMEASPGRPILVDKFLESAVEVDVDCLSDGNRVVIGGVMQHIEEAGIHSGDSACVIPPHSLPLGLVETIKTQSRALTAALKVKGLMNIQFAITGVDRASASTTATIYVLEANPRASRTVPFVSKAIGVPLARLAALVMVGKTLDELGVADEVVPKHFSVKESVFPFNKFPGVDIILGPEMRSTGEVMGIDDSFPMAFAKSQMAANSPLPEKGTIFVSVADRDKAVIIPIARQFAEMGYHLIGTRGTAKALRDQQIPIQEIPKIQEGRPNLIDMMKNGQIAMILNTPSGRGRRTDEGRIRSAAVAHRVTCITTLAAAQAAVEACRAMRQKELTVTALQDRFQSPT